MPAKKQAETATIQLNHICNLPEAQGLPGDRLAVPADVAKRLIERGGAIGITSTENNSEGNEK